MHDLRARRGVFRIRWPWRPSAARTPNRNRPPPGDGGLVTKVARGSLAAFAVYIAGAAITYCTQLALARAIGADGYGVYAYVLAWVTVLAYGAALGFNVSLMRFVPAYLAQKAWALLGGVIRYASRRTIAAGCSVAVVGGIIVLNRAAELTPNLAATFLVGLTLVPILASLWIRGAIVRALGGVASALAPDRMLRDTVLLGLIGVAGISAWRTTFGAPAAMAATVIGATVGLGFVSFAM